MYSSNLWEATAEADCQSGPWPGIVRGRRLRKWGSIGPSATACPGLGRARGNARTAGRARAPDGSSGERAAGLWRKRDQLSAGRLQVGREGGGGVSARKLIQSPVWGGRRRGPWPRHQGQQKRPQEKRTVETSETNRCHPPGHECGAGSRLDRAQEARRPLNSYQPHPPWPAQRTRDRPRSLSTEIKRGRR